MSMDPNQMEMFLQELEGQAQGSGMLPGDPVAEQMPPEADQSGLPSPEQAQSPQQPEMSQDPMDAMPPEMAGAFAQEPAGPTTDQALSTILDFMIRTIGREKELDVKLIADATNTLASAYKSLADAGANAGIHPQDQLMLEQQKLAQERAIAQQKADLESQISQEKMAHEIEMSKQKYELEQAKAMLDMHLKRQQSEQDAAHKDEQHQVQIETAAQGLQHTEQAHQQKLSLQERQAQEAQADASTNRDLKVQESQARQKSMASKPAGDSKASS